MSSELLKEIESLTALARINLETSTNNLKAIDTLGVRIDTMGTRMEQSHKDAMARMDRMESDWDKKHRQTMEQMDEQHHQTMKQMAEQHQQAMARLDKLEAIANSNARAIQAWGDRAS